MEQNREQRESETQKKLQGTGSGRVCDDGSHGVYDRAGALLFIGSFCRI